MLYAVPSGKSVPEKPVPGAKPGERHAHRGVMATGEVPNRIRRPRVTVVDSTAKNFRRTSRSIRRQMPARITWERARIRDSRRWADVTAVGARGLNPPRP